MTTKLKQNRGDASRKSTSELLRTDLESDRTVATFEIHYSQFLDRSGRPLRQLPPFAEDPEVLVPIYKAMVLTRLFDAKAISLQRTGNLGTYPSCRGQEAVGVGVASAMKDDDVLLVTYREQGAQLWRGVTLTELFQFWGGDERGSNYSGPREDFPVCIPVATHAGHAVGVATAFKLRRQARAAVCVLGDGATSKGDFYEAVNLAGVWRLPVVFIVSNNQWAISVSREAQTASETLAQKAIAGGFEGEQVDGNDVIAVRHAAEQAIQRARAGHGPSLIEALTYRLGDHTTADDASRYRDQEEVSAQRARDPVERLRNFLGNQGWWTNKDEDDLIAECTAKIESAKDEYLAIVPEPPGAMFDHLYESLPTALARQRKSVAGEDDV